jgi:hypothetical protein
VHDYDREQDLDLVQDHNREQDCCTSPPFEASFEENLMRLGSAERPTLELTLAQQLRQQLADAFTEAGWKVEQEVRSHTSTVDLRIERDHMTRVVVLSVSRDARRTALESLLARAILVGRAASRELKADPIAVVGAANISDAMLRELQMFVTLFGGGTAWGVVDSTGLIEVFGQHLEGVQRSRKRKGNRLSIPSRVDLFSDLSQWMLKLLLNYRLPEPLRFAPGAPIPTVAALAAQSGVAVPTVNRFIRTLRAEGFCEERLPLKVIREEELFEKWRAANAKVPFEIRARWILRPHDAEKRLADLLHGIGSATGDRLCLGLFAACARQGLGFVRGVSSHLYMENISIEKLEHMGLVATDPHESADVFVRSPRFPEAVFRGARAIGGIPVADVFQCWLDVSHHAARGAEMADYLYDRVLRSNIFTAGSGHGDQ